MVSMKYFFSLSGDHWQRPFPARGVRKNIDVESFQKRKRKKEVGLEHRACKETVFFSSAASAKSKKQTCGY